jgi:O-antigen ligase
MPSPPFDVTPNWSDLTLFIPVAFAMTAMWWIPEGDKYVPAIILVMLVYFVVSKRWRSCPGENTFVKGPFSVVITLTALVCGVGYLLKDGNISELRTLSALAIYSGISICMVLTHKAWRTIVLFSGAAFIAVCFYQSVINGVPRAHLNYNPIPFATGLATVLISSLSLAVTSVGLKLRLIAWTTTLLLFIALAMTGTRGVVLPVTLILGVTITYLLFRYASSNRITVAGVGLAIIVAIAIGGEIFEKRIDATMSEMTLIEAGDETGSIGLRLQFWKAALKMLTLEPLTGLGETHKPTFQHLADQGLVNQAAADYAPYHYHNQYLDTLVKRGVPGLLVLLGLLLTPPLLAFKYFRNNKLVLGSILGITFMYAVASLTDVPFNHPVTINIFVLSMISLLSLKSDRDFQLGLQRTTL